MIEKPRSVVIMENEEVRKALNAIGDTFLNAVQECDGDASDDMKNAYVQVAFTKAQHQLKVLRTNILQAYADEKARLLAVLSPAKIEAPRHKRRGRPPKFS